MNIIKSAVLSNAKVNSQSSAAWNISRIIPFKSLSEHFPIKSSKEKFRFGADRHRADWKRRTSLRHFLTTVERTNHLLDGTSERSNQLVNYCTIAVSTIREQHKANSHVHQFSGRLGVLGISNLWHNVRWLTSNQIDYRYLQIFLGNTWSRQSRLGASVRRVRWDLCCWPLVPQACATRCLTRE